MTFTRTTFTAAALRTYLKNDVKIALGALIDATAALGHDFDAPLFTQRSRAVDAFNGACMRRRWATKAAMVAAYEALADAYESFLANEAHTAAGGTLSPCCNAPTKKGMWDNYCTTCNYGTNDALTASNVVVDLDDAAANLEAVAVELERAEATLAASDNADLDAAMAIMGITATATPVEVALDHASEVTGEACDADGITQTDRDLNAQVGLGGDDWRVADDAAQRAADDNTKTRKADEAAVDARIECDGCGGAKCSHMRYTWDRADVDAEGYSRRLCTDCNARGFSRAHLSKPLCSCCVNGLTDSVREERTSRDVNWIRLDMTMPVAVADFAVNLTNESLRGWLKDAGDETRCRFATKQFLVDLVTSVRAGQDEAEARAASATGCGTKVQPDGSVVHCSLSARHDGSCDAAPRRCTACDVRLFALRGSHCASCKGIVDARRDYSAAKASEASKVSAATQDAIAAQAAADAVSDLAEATTRAALRKLGFPQQLADRLCRDAEVQESIAADLAG